MDKTIEMQTGFFETHFHEIQFAVLFGAMILFFLIEGFYPRKELKDSQANRWINNIILTLFNHFFMITFSVIAFGALSFLKPESPLVDYFKLSDIPAFIVVFIAMEFFTYWMHRAFHKFKLLWRVHAVHHSDTEIDITTTHRHHPFEPMLITLILSPIVFLIGAPLISLALYNFIHVVFVSFNHSNLVLPKKLDAVLRLFVITPDYHRVHHSSDVKHTDSNFGVVVPWFDYLFGTATSKPNSELATMEIGLEKMRSPKDSRIDQLLLTPFTYK